MKAIVTAPTQKKVGGGLVSNFYRLPASVRAVSSPTTIKKSPFPPSQSQNQGRVSSPASSRFTPGFVREFRAREKAQELATDIAEHQEKARSARLAAADAVKEARMAESHIRRAKRTLEQKKFFPLSQPYRQAREEYEKYSEKYSVSREEALRKQEEADIESGVVAEKYAEGQEVLRGSGVSAEKTFGGVRYSPPRVEVPEEKSWQRQKRPFGSSAMEAELRGKKMEAEREGRSFRPAEGLVSAPGYVRGQHFSSIQRQRQFELDVLGGSMERQVPVMEERAARLNRVIDFYPYMSESEREVVDSELARHESEVKQFEARQERATELRAEEVAARSPFSVEAAGRAVESGVIGSAVFLGGKGFASVARDVVPEKGVVVPTSSSSSRIALTSPMRATPQVLDVVFGKKSEKQAVRDFLSGEIDFFRPTKISKRQAVYGAEALGRIEAGMVVDTALLRGAGRVVRGGMAVMRGQPLIKHPGRLTRRLFAPDRSMSAVVSGKDSSGARIVFSPDYLKSDIVFSGQQRNIVSGGGLRRAIGRRLFSGTFPVEFRAPVTLSGMTPVSQVADYGLGVQAIEKQGYSKYAGSFVPGSKGTPVHIVVGGEQYFFIPTTRVPVPTRTAALADPVISQVVPSRTYTGVVSSGKTSIPIRQTSRILPRQAFLEQSTISFGPGQELTRSETLSRSVFQGAVRQQPVVGTAYQKTKLFSGQSVQKVVPEFSGVGSGRIKSDIVLPGRARGAERIVFETPVNFFVRRDAPGRVIQGVSGKKTPLSRTFPSSPSKVGKIVQQGQQAASKAGEVIASTPLQAKTRLKNLFSGTSERVAMLPAAITPRYSIPGSYSALALGLSLGREQAKTLPVEKPSTVERLEVRLSPGTRLEFDARVKESINVRPVIRDRIVPTTRVRPASTTRPAARQPEVVQPTIVLPPDFRIREKTKTTPITSTPPELETFFQELLITPTVIPPPITTSTPILSPQQQPEVSQQPPRKTFEPEKGFHVFIRKGGKMVRVSTTPLAQRSALGLGSLIVGKTPARTFVLRAARGSGKKIQGLTGYFKPEQFRRPKGASKLPGGSWVERAKYAIDRIGEKKGITEKGLAVRRSIFSITPTKRGVVKKVKKKRKKKGGFFFR